MTPGAAESVNAMRPVRGPTVSPEAVAWAFRELGRRAGAPVETRGGEIRVAGIPVRYGAPQSVPSPNPSLGVVPCSATAWEELLARPEGTLDFVSLEESLPRGVRAAHLDAKVPVLFWGEGQRAFAGPLPDGSIIFGADLVATTLFFLCRWEETVTTERDEHARMPHTASVAYRQGILDRPVVDEYALILREWLRAMRPGWQPARHSFRVLLSHDVDVVRPLATFWGGVRTAVGDLARRGSVLQARKTAATLIRQTAAPRRNPHYRGLFRLAEISRRHRILSAFYFMTAERSAQDSGYDLSRGFVREAAERLRSEGFEIGFHAGYRTLDDPERLAEEKARFDRIVGVTRYGGRQHFLRFRVPDTWRHLERLGFAHDSTLTFAGHEGFRCGTCHPYRPFDMEANREIDLEEIPLIVMDGTLRQYRRLTPEEGTRRVLELAERCRRVEGTFTLLWHNTSLDEEWEPWGRAYEEMVAGLAQLRDEPLGLGRTRKDTADRKKSLMESLSAHGSRGGRNPR